MKRVSVLFVLSVLFHLVAAPTTHAQTLKRIKIGYPSLSFRQSNVWVAKEMGLFNKYGLEVEPILFRGGQVATQALVSGDPPIVNIGTVVQATIQGHNVVLVAAVETKYDLIIFTRRGITQLEQLKGKRLGITGFNSATHYASIILARHFNADFKDLTLIPSRPRHRAHRRRYLRRSRRDLRRYFGCASGAQSRLAELVSDRRSRRRSARQRLCHVARLHR